MKTQVVLVLLSLGPTVGCALIALIRGWKIKRLEEEIRVLEEEIRLRDGEDR